MKTCASSGPSGSGATSTSLPAPSVALTGPLLVGGGQVAHDRVEHAVDADLVRGRCHQHGRQDRVAHAAVEAGVQLLVGDLLALEVLGQDVVVGLGGGLQQLVAAARDLVGQLGRNLDL